jgi:hypothetical protein
MSGDDQVVCREIKVAIAFVVGRVALEDTPGGAWGELMWRSGSHVRVARTRGDARRRARKQTGQDEDTQLGLPLWEDSLTGM